MMLNLIITVKTSPIDKGNVTTLTEVLVVYEFFSSLYFDFQGIHC